MEQRGKVQGLLGSTWGIAGLVGPFLGGLLIDIASWHWIFFINIPFGILTLFIIQTSFKENFERRPHSIDFLGFVVLTASMLVFLSIFIFIFNSQDASYLTWQNMALLAISIALIILFVFIEKRVREPIVSLDVLDRSSIIINIVSFLFTAALLGVDVYLPIYLQNVYGFTPLIAGLTLIPMTISWVAISFPLGKLIVRFGIKPITLISLLLTASGVILILLFTEHSPFVLVLLVIFGLGFGFGSANNSQTMFIQDSVGYEKRGQAVSLNSLVRSLGQTIGISVFGATFNFAIISGFANSGIVQYDLGNLYDMSAYAEGVQWSQVATVLSDAIHSVVWVLFALIIVATVVALWLPRRKRADMRSTDK
jgi:MFS family permease